MKSFPGAAALLILSKGLITMLAFLCWDSAFLYVRWIQNEEKRFIPNLAQHCCKSLSGGQQSRRAVKCGVCRCLLVSLEFSRCDTFGRFVRLQICRNAWEQHSKGCDFVFGNDKKIFECANILWGRSINPTNLRFVTKRKQPKIVIKKGKISLEVLMTGAFRKCCVTVTCLRCEHNYLHQYHKGQLKRQRPSPSCCLLYFPQHMLPENRWPVSFLDIRKITCVHWWTVVLECKTCAQYKVFG